MFFKHTHTSEGCPGGLPQGVGSVHHHWGGSSRSGDIHQTIPTGHWQSVEGNCLWRSDHVHNNHQLSVHVSGVFHIFITYIQDKLMRGLKGLEMCPYFNALCNIFGM